MLEVKEGETEAVIDSVALRLELVLEDGELEGVVDSVPLLLALADGDEDDDMELVALGEADGDVVVDPVTLRLELPLGDGE